MTAAQSQEPTEAELADGGHRPFVLVVDDSPDMRHLIVEVLEGEGCEVAGAASGARALNIMADRLPDLVITDLFMPGMSGFTLRAVMLRRPELAEIPVIVLSAYWQRSAETLDADEVLTKPLNIDRLLAAVRRLTAQRTEDGGVYREAEGRG